MHRAHLVYIIVCVCVCVTKHSLCRSIKDAALVTLHHIPTLFSLSLTHKQTLTSKHTNTHTHKINPLHTLVTGGNCDFKHRYGDSIKYTDSCSVTDGCVTPTAVHVQVQREQLLLRPFGRRKG